MKILIVTEKPSMSRALAPHVRAHWPNDEITLVNAVPYANLKFSYPRGGRLSDYPSVAEPHFSLADMEKWACPPFTMNAAGELAQVPMDLRYFKEADLIVQACDPDHRGAITFEGIMAQVFGDNRALACPSLRLLALDDESIRKALSNLRPFGETSEASLAYGHVKNYFDFNFNMNSLVVLGAALRQSGAGADAPPLSKFSLQLLYALRSIEGMTAGGMHRMMEKWKGTGKYPYQPHAWNAQLGGVASRSQIIDNLIAAGLLEPAGVSPQLRISARGLQLLESLHPDCRDLDLPFRIEAWGQQGLEVARPAIDKYIRTFFGKQLRFATTSRSHAQRASEVLTSESRKERFLQLMAPVAGMSLTEHSVELVELSNRIASEVLGWHVRDGDPRRLWCRTDGTPVDVEFCPGMTMHICQHPYRPGFNEDDDFAYSPSLNLHKKQIDWVQWTLDEISK